MWVVVFGEGVCVCFARCWWVFGRRLPLWGGASCCCTLSEPCLLRSQPGISRLEGRVVTGRLFVCCPGFPLPALDFSLGIFVERLCLCFSRRRWRLAASNALLALRRLFGSKVSHLATLLSPGLASFCSRCLCLCWLL